MSRLATKRLGMNSDMMTRALACFGLILLVAGVPPAEPRASEAREAAALRAARAWLATVDGGRYDESLDAASGFFKTAITKAHWRRALEGVRRPLGKARERTLRGSTYARELPGAPDGHYVVIQFATRFENKQAAVETITPMLDQDGEWRIAGYFIK